MRLTELRLERFGYFADVTLPLDGNGLTLLYGANEAGKSTLLAALRACLFGFPRGEAFDFRWPSDTIAVGGTLAFADGAIAEVRREKKRGLRGKLGDVALTDELLKQRLGRPSAEMFATVFAFSLDDLARGGEALRDEGLRAAIAGAGLGAARSPQAVIEELRAQADSLFTVKGRGGKLINATLAELKELERSLRDSQVRSDDHRGRVEARDAARQEAETLGRTRAELLRRIGDQEALLRALPRRDELRGALVERATLAPPPLPPTAGEEFERALAERARLGKRAEEIDAKLARAQREAETLTVDEALLSAAPRIRPLHEGLGRHVEEQRQAEELAGGVRTRRLELSRQLSELREGWALDDLDVLPGPLFATSLERLRDGWSAQRDRGAELERMAGEERLLDDAWQALKRRLDPPWPIDATDAFLPVPRAEEVKQHRAALRDHDRALAERRRDLERLRTERRDLEGKRSRLEAGGVVPSTEELHRLRATRDQALGELRRSLSGAATRAAERGQLADQFEAAMRAADAHADELRRRSDDVAKRDELLLRLGDVDRALADCANDVTAAQDARTRAEAAWQALWTRCGFQPQSPDTMLEWLEDHARLREVEAKRARVTERRAALTGAQDDYKQRLRVILATLKLDERMELAAAKRVVDTVLAVRDDLERLRQDEERARKLSSSVASWRNEVKRLCHDVAPPLAAADGAAAMRELHDRLSAAHAAAAKRGQLAALEAELRDERQAVTVAQRALAAAIAEWLTRAAVTDETAFLAAATAARRAHALDREIERLRRAVAESRGAMAVAAFDAALETAERSVVDAERSDLETRLAGLEGAYRAAAERVGAAEATLAQLDGGARAAEIGAGIESRRAELRGLVEQYSVVTLARALLERQVARFQERHQPRMIEELSSLFAALTEGRYRRVYPRYDDEATFVAVRADGVEVTPAAMSTGTREQLWLAVRLAYVRHYCEGSEPLPLVLDDVLVNFDAARTRATLSVLSEFAKKTQVVLLTCHAHLVEMARDVAAVEPLALSSA